MPDGLLLLPGFPLDATMWTEQVDALGGSVPTVAADVPGFGNAPLVGDVTSMDAIADAAEAETRGTGIDRFVVCGLSMGGYAALAFWRRHRDRVAGLVLANTRAGADDEAGKQRRADLARRVREEGVEFLADNPPPLLSSQVSQELVQRIQEMIRRQSPEAVAAASLGMAERPDSTPDLAGIDVPTLVITSSDDELIPPDATREMAQQIPNAQLGVIEGAGHLSNLEAPEEFNRLLHAHLERVGAIG